jgi:serine/threonine protein kinase
MIKIIELGFAKILSPHNSYRTTTNCGTVGYTAPEILLGMKEGYSL